MTTLASEGGVWWTCAVKRDAIYVCVGVHKC